MIKASEYEPKETSDYQNDSDYCPVNNDGRHQYFIFKTFETYERVREEHFDVTGKHLDSNFYVQAEYANSGCKCGRVIKQRIVEGKN